MNSTRKYDLDRLNTYDVQVPSRLGVIMACVAGWVILVGGFAYLVYIPLHWLFVTSNTSYYDESQASERPWWVAPVISLAIAILGVCVATVSHGAYKKYFVEVRQGYVVSMDTSGGTTYVVNGIGVPDPLSWDVQLYGYTYANELRYYWTSLTAGSWRDTEEGELIDLS